MRYLLPRLDFVLTVVSSVVYFAYFCFVLSEHGIMNYCAESERNLGSLYILNIFSYKYIIFHSLARYMPLKRPTPDDTEDDILRLQAQFLKKKEGKVKKDVISLDPTPSESLAGMYWSLLDLLAISN